jgi:hypothetical protein
VHIGHRLPGSSNTYTACAHRSTARRPRRGAHTGELQHGAVRCSTVQCATCSTALTARCAHRGATARRGALLTSRQHSAHGAVHPPRSYSTAQCASHRQQHGMCDAAHVPENYSTVQCATAPRHCIARKQARALQGTAGRRATKALPEHTRGRDAQHNTDAGMEH